MSSSKKSAAARIQKAFYRKQQTPRHSHATEADATRNSEGAILPRAVSATATLTYCAERDAPAHFF
jgi:hypothetical protein